MRFSEKWLREWVDPSVSTQVLCEQLTMAGLEVDAAEPTAPALDGVVVGRIVAVAPHPDADRLRVCSVDDGSEEPLQVVCGAPNARAGLCAPFARIGAALPGGLKIKKSKLRGVASHGMLCSMVELALGEDASGLFELPADAPAGTPIADYLELDDTEIEVDLTPNRGDCLGLAGIAREVGVLNRAEVRPAATTAIAPEVEDTFPVELLAPEGCPRYVGRVIRGIDPTATTPLWMQERLRRSGIRSLGPLVDVTNYVMLELGQPMHAFDLDRLRGGIVVRWARTNETILLLDGREVALDEETLVIADREQAVAIAGVMGGELSGIAETTTSLFLESAFFAPAMISGRARRYGMHTDASHRFERGVDPELQLRAVKRATELLLQIVGGRPGPVREAASADHLPVQAPVLLRRARIGHLLGIDLPDAEVEEILMRLGMRLEAVDGGWSVTPPSYRFDIAIEPDLVEELARIHGYENVPNSRPRSAMTIRPQTERQAGAPAAAALLVERGYHEAITFSFVDAAKLSLLDPDAATIALANPLSAELAVMRTTLWAGLLDALAYNRRRQQERVRLFETGLRFVVSEGQTLQEPMISGVVGGAVLDEQWGVAACAADFFDVKADVEALLGLTSTDDAPIFSADTHPALHPGQAARIRRGDQELGWMGSLDPRVAKELGLRGNILLFELSLDALGEGGVPRFAPLSKFPAIRRDIAVVVADEVAAGQIHDAVRVAAGAWLQELQLFDIFTGKGVDSGRKSVALGLTLQHASRNLTNEEADALVARVVDDLADRVGAELRE